MVQAQAITPVQPTWTEIKRPIPVYAFSGGPFGRDPDSYSALRGIDGSRIDNLTFKANIRSSSKLWMHVRLHRFKHGRQSSERFFIAMARIAAEKGLAVTASAFPNILPTRFGRFAVADLQLERNSNKRPCLGYRLEADKPALTIAGIVCGTISAPVDRRTLACVLDRLDVVSARDDRELLKFVANSELKRGKPCNSRFIANAGNSRTAWLDQETPKKAVAALRLKTPGTRKYRR